MKYLDTNVLVYAVENHPKYGNACKNILLDIESEKLDVCSSILVLVEFLNVLTKINKVLAQQDKQLLNIRKNIDAVLSLPFVWFDLNFFTIKRAAEYDFNISGVDFVHIASMELNLVQEIISADKELDKVTIIKRIDPLDY
ncbi:MAG: type II toxin-antitoxin system VapC family toxin [Promethearchaeota archaeon]